MWTYIQKTGQLFHNGESVATGYSGYDDPQTSQEGKNNPDLENVADVGPIPVGNYAIGTPVDTVTHGPFVLPLTPDPANEMFGRAGFLMHGDSVVEPGTASRGCIIMGRPVRDQVAASGDNSLQVISGVAEESRVA
jgi:hypothetical protein